MGAGQSDTERVSLPDFELLKLVGRGAFAQVWQVRKKDTGEIYAMKVLRKSDIVKQKLIKHINLERDIMVELGNHPFIITLHWAFQTDEKLYFVLDYVNGGSLFHHLRLHKGGFPEERVKFYAAEIIVALETLHQHNIVYRDLKLENILIDRDGHIRLTDFGLSHKMPKDGNKIHSFSGTAAYIAPEIISDAGEGHGKSVDWWSFGVLLHLLFFQEPPFWADDERTLLKKIVSDKVQLKNTNNLTPEAISLLRGLLTRDARYRLGCGENGQEDTKPIRTHPFFSSIDWDLLLQKRYPPPWVPQLDGILDSRYSDETGADVLHEKTGLYPSNEKYTKSAFKDFYFSRAASPKAIKDPHGTPAILQTSSTQQPSNEKN